MPANHSRTWITAALCAHLLFVTGCPGSSDDGGSGPASVGADASLDQREPGTSENVDGPASAEGPANPDGPPDASAAAGAGGSGGAGAEADGGMVVGEADGSLVAGDSGTVLAPADAGLAADTTPAAPEEALHGVAVISSDDVTSALSLAGLDATAVTKDECLHSGTVSPKLTTPWSNDLRVASSVQPHHEIAIIDQQNGTITRVAGDTCEVIQQASVGAGFAARPFDLVGGLPGNKLYVTRSVTNPANPSEGGDVVILDATTGAVRGRIDLTAQVPTGGPVDKPWRPFPKGALLFAGKVYVVLGNKNADDTSFGAGRLVVIDPNTDTVSASIALTQKNCGAIQPFFGGGSPSRFVIGCSGVRDSSTHYGWDGAGVGDVDVGTNPPTVTADISTPPHSDEGIFSNTDIAAYDFFYIGLKKAQNRVPHDDQAWAYELDPTAPPLYGGAVSAYGEIYTRLSMRLDPVHGHLYVTNNAPRSEANGVHILDFHHALPDPGKIFRSFLANPASGRTARQLGFY
jgi:hypothetical protein